MFEHAVEKTLGLVCSEEFDQTLSLSTSDLVASSNRMLEKVLKYIVLFTLVRLGTFGAILDDNRSEEHPQGLPDNNKNGYSLIIYPQSQQSVHFLFPHILLKRVDDTLNLTCKIEVIEEVKKNNNNSAADEHLYDQVFRLSWYPPFGLENSNRVSNFESRNSLQLIVDKLKESDAGEYKCQTELLPDYTANRFTYVSTILVKVKPRKGSCSDPMFSCSSGECIAKRYVCDGKKDCKSQDDESLHQCGTWNPCEGRLRCEDGRCISSSWCCDRTVDKNCSVRTMPKCCLQLQPLQINLDVSQYSPQPQHYNDMGFLQTTIYTVIGCSMAFMFIITIMVIAICRVHLKRTALARYPHHLNRSGPDQRLDSWGNIFLHPPPVPYASSGSGLLVTYNINNGVQFMGNRAVNPPPYSEVMRIPPREGPPPPYDSRENVSAVPLSQPSSSPSRNNIFRASSTTNELNLRRRADYAQENSTDEPTLEPLLQNDNNNGDINGNSTEGVQVEPNRNT